MTYSTTLYFLPRCHFPGVIEDTDGLVPPVYPRLMTLICISFHLEGPDKSNPRDISLTSLVFLMRLGIKQFSILMAQFILYWVC
jgi:hypothetical protein